MRAVPVYEAKNRFSELIAAAEQGDEVSITRRGVPVARLIAASPATDCRRRFNIVRPAGRTHLEVEVLYSPGKGKS